MQSITALEFFSGIGGFHYAFDAAIEATGLAGRVLDAFDINSIGNAVYARNFGKAPQQRSVESVTAAQLDKYSADLWMMSPPCQPYSRLGKQQGSADPRAKGFLHLIDLLPQLRSSPTYILIENVKGFEVSDTRDVLVEQLRGLGYQVQEFMLSPNQFGIPNSRLRYFLLASRPGFGSIDSAESLRLAIPGCAMRSPTSLDAAESFEDSCRPLSDYLDPPDVTQDCAVPDDVVLKYGMLADIRQASARASCCFTKGYGKHFERAGSVLQTAEATGPVTDAQSLLALKLRFFSPAEVARLHGFPPSFAFPDSVSLRQRWALLGNSLNVAEVAELLKYLFRAAGEP
eukprot:TRINITY_DN14531_c0_g1_i1.p1 TRINITY_DN14531_c0_g1~~TRINITY_DN14531_c0_g1_i1.p1  ORF type:complete len:344 (+),score=101.51 TRINITY_DN14531_c0_g1_i1:300-1331(+)